eukprot:TRINITY_DN5141_c1_g1_i7.p1 TRINITY_DN5141_c1_g1~~TRINITY_DN5141_c1_g1_i7.p1  ORF type:complete len:364 (-),score=57.18 TRINITY_DN5141_c1_g1_i7:213-1304(-)
MRLVEEGPGYETLNTMVAERMQRWFVEVADMHVRSLYEIVSPTAQQVEEACRITAQILKSYYLLSDANKGKSLGNICVVYWKECGGQSLHSVADVFRWLGECLTVTNELQLALDTFKDALQVLWDAGENVSRRAAHVKTVYANTLRRLGRYDQALCECESARKIFNATGSLETDDAALNVQLHGYTLRDLGRLEEAVAMLQQACAMYDVATGGRCPQTATCHSGSGSVFLQLGRLDNAREAFFKSTKLYEAAGSQTSTHALRNVVRTAELNELQGQLDEAIVEYRRAIRLYEARGQGKYVSCAAAHMALGAALEKQGQHSKSLRHFQEALSIYSESGALSNKRVRECKNAIDRVKSAAWKSPV